MFDEKEYQKQYREKHKASMKVYQRQWYKKNKDKTRASNLRRYGITLVQWNEMFAVQGYRCKLCRTDAHGGKGWHTDHSHVTGRVRGILCHHCNTMLGLAKESPLILQQAIKYLECAL